MRISRPSEGWANIGDPIKDLLERNSWMIALLETEKADPMLIKVPGIGVQEAVDPISTRESANTNWESAPVERADDHFRRVLDHGHVRLVGSLGNDLSVVRAARVSYDADWRAGEDSGSDKRLINYLIRNKHTSPFEHVVFTLDVKAPLFVIRQWQRHRTWSYSEVSARYTELPEEFYVPSEETITTQSSSNKQMRTDEQHANAPFFRADFKRHSERAFALYKDMIEFSCPRELARMVLPLNTYSHMFATVNLHNLFHFLRLRLHEHAQYEIRVYAEAILDLIKQVVPVCVEAFMEQSKSASGGTTR